MFDNMPRGTIVIEDLEIGMTRHLRKVVTDRDIELFAEVSTDRNPVHLDDAYARDTIFEGRIAHGMLTAGLISAVIGEQLPGHGSRTSPVRASTCTSHPFVPRTFTTPLSGRTSSRSTSAHVLISASGTPLAAVRMSGNDSAGAPDAEPTCVGG